MDMTLIKGIIIKSSIAIIAFFSPLQYIILTIFTLLLADLITGLWEAIKLKEKVTSHKLSRSISKMFLYTLTLMVGYMLQIHILNNSLPIDSLIGFYICTTEFYSLLENVRHITGSDILSFIIDKIEGFKGDRDLEKNRNLNEKK